MRSVILVCFLMVTGISGVFAEDSFKHLNLTLDLSLRSAGGKAADDVKSGLTPNPTSVSGANFGIAADYFFLKNFGITGGYDFQGPIQASAPKVKAPLNVFTLSVYRLGLAGRIYIKDDPEYDEFTYIKCFAGANMGFLKLHDDFKALILDYETKRGNTVTFYDGFAYGIGFSAGATVEMTMGIFLVGGGLYLESYSLKFKGATDTLDFMNFVIPAYVGVAF